MDLSKIINNIKILIEIFNKCLKYCDKSHINAFVRIILTGILLYIVILEIYIKNHYYESAIKQKNIHHEASLLVKECGKYSFVSWIVIDDNPLNINKKKFVFKDVLGCLEGSCPTSVMQDNPLYNQEYLLNYDDYDFLSKIPDGSLIKYDLKDGKLDIKQKIQYVPAILNHIVENTNLPMSQIRFTVVRDYKNSLVYVFALTFADIAEPQCSNHNANSLLINLYNNAKANL